jgi:hypothetical protein
MSAPSKCGYTAGQHVVLKVDVLDERGEVVKAGTLLRLAAFAPKVRKTPPCSIGAPHYLYTDGRDYFYNAVRADQLGDTGRRIRENFCTIKKSHGEIFQHRYIISEYRKGRKETWYVCARSGYMRRSDGTMARDGEFPGGPEWTTRREHALEFDSHRAAARVRSRCPSATVTPI